MLNNKLIWTLSGVALLVIIFLFTFNRKSSVQGEVTMDGVPIAAGSILFQSESASWTVPIYQGRYELQDNQLAGKYQVKIEVNFVDARDAASYYADVNAELNEKKMWSKPKSVKAEAEKPFVFEEELRSGSNTRDFELTR